MLVHKTLQVVNARSTKMVDYVLDGRRIATTWVA